MRNRILSAMGALTVILAMSCPVLAQGWSDSPREAGSYYAEPRTMETRAGEPRRDSQRWVRVGYDYNDDGHIDRFEYLNVQDLEMARQRSMQRQGTAGVSQRDLPERVARGYSADQPAAGKAVPDRPLNSVSGTVLELREFGVAGVGQNHLLGKVETPEGRIARVDFGPVDNLKGIDLRQGDRVTVHGTTGTMNDNTMLMAHRIEAGDRMVNVGWPNDRNMSRYSGEVLSVQTAGFANPNVPEQVFARVLLDRGGVTAVNLGPTQTLQMAPEDLRGKQIDFLAHPARIGDKVALVADELRVEGRTYQVDWSMMAPRS